MNINRLENGPRQKILDDVFKSSTRISTNIHGKLTMTAIDSIATNIPQNIIECDVNDPGISDHAATFLYIKDTLPQNKTTTVKRKLKIVNDENLDQLLHNLHQIDWSKMRNIIDVNEAFCYFLGIITTYTDNT